MVKMWYTYYINVTKTCRGRNKEKIVLNKQERK